MALNFREPPIQSFGSSDWFGKNKWYPTRAIARTRPTFLLRLETTL